MPSHYIKGPGASQGKRPAARGQAPTTKGPIVIPFAFGSQRMLMRSLARLSLTAAVLLVMAAALQTLAAPALARPVGTDAGGEGPDIAELALLTMGAILAAGAVGLVLYVVRQRIGFWLHRPPPRGGGEGTEHH